MGGSNFVIWKEQGNHFYVEYTNSSHPTDESGRGVCIVEIGSRDQGEHPHDDQLLRVPLLAESTNDNGPDIGAMKQHDPREQSRNISNISRIRNLVCDNSNEAEEESINNSSSSSSSSTNDEDHQQQQQPDSNDVSTSGTVNNNTTIGKEILEIAVPALAGLAIDPFMTVMDTIFVGRTSTNAAALAGMCTYNIC